MGTRCAPGADRCRRPARLERDRYCGLPRHAARCGRHPRAGPAEHAQPLAERITQPVAERDTNSSARFAHARTERQPASQWLAVTYPEPERVDSAGDRDPPGTSARDRRRRSCAGDRHPGKRRGGRDDGGDPGRVGCHRAQAGRQGWSRPPRCSAGRRRCAVDQGRHAHHSRRPATAGGEFCPGAGGSCRCDRRCGRAARGSTAAGTGHRDEHPGAVDCRQRGFHYR